MVGQGSRVRLAGELEVQRREGKPIQHSAPRIRASCLTFECAARARRHPLVGSVRGKREDHRPRRHLRRERLHDDDRLLEDLRVSNSPAAQRAAQRATSPRSGGTAWGRSYLSRPDLTQLRLARRAMSEKAQAVADEIEAGEADGNIHVAQERGQVRSAASLRQPISSPTQPLTRHTVP